jgi:hypothetical protein
MRLSTRSYRFDTSGVMDCDMEDSGGLVRLTYGIERTLS